MKLETTEDTAATFTASRRSRCVCCAGAIETSSDQDMAVGLNVVLGLVSDECALICDGCTSQLIAARAAAMPPKRRRH
ncbi:MAG: hypothetical protein ABW175_09375 [Bradyrhizobium sp.]